MASRYLNNITINDAYTFPTADGTDGQVITTNGSGTLSFADAAASDAIVLTVKNISGGSLSKGTVVHPSPSASPPSGNVIEVIAADKSAASTMPAIGVLNETLADNGEGECIAFGSVTGIDTSSFSAGDPIYVGASGGFTITKPSGTDLIQKIGIVVKVHASNGSIKVFGANRTNDVPAPLYVDIPNGRLGVGVTSPEYALDVRTASNSPMQIRSNTGVTRFRLRNSSTTSMIGAEGDDFIFYPDNAERMRITGDGKVGIGQSSPDVSLDISATDAVQMPSGTTAQRPTGEAGMFRYNSEEGQFEGYTTEWGAIAGSGGGDTGTVTIEKNVYTGDGSDTTFNTTSTIVDEKNVQVYIDGIYQSKDNYSTSGSTVTFSTAPPNGVSVELIHIVAITGQTSLDKFTGDGSTTAFNLSQTIDSENNVQVYIDGVYQSKDNYSTSGNTLTFTTAPANNAAIEAVHIKAVDLSAMNSDQFTGDGSTTAFTLTNSPSSSDKTLVFIQGVYQEKSTYSISGTTLTFTTAPPNGYTIEVVVYSKITIADNTVNIERFTGDGSDTDFVLTNPPSSANNLDVYISGLYQEKNTYTFSGSTITLNEAPVTGAVVECRSVANISNVVAASNDFFKLQWITTPKTSAFTAVANRGYFVDTSSSEITVTLPSSPTAGDVVHLVDYAGNAATNNITITSSDDIMDSADDKVINYNNGAVQLVYSGSTKGWLVASAANETATALGEDSFNVDFLVVAGGGGGSSGGGAGGAGGLRTSYGSTTGGGGSAESSLTILPATNYTVTVGAGGADGVNGSKGNNGSNSVFSTITSTGGGAGGAGYVSVNETGSDGGSGGGGGRDNTTTGQGGLAVTSPVIQGYAGGTGGSDAATWSSGGGGGGASAAGSNGVNGQGGNGGNGLAVSITGSSVTYAGGGGGSAYNTHTAGSGGTGGGGNGSNSYATATSGTVNTGGGGGASYTDSTSSGDGGSGVVILRYPSSRTITVGAGLTSSTSTDGSDKVTTFTAGTGTISFS
jgi:hypothetical protein